MASPLPPDPYNALGVPKDATLATIRSAHRKLVLTCHPDKVVDEKAKAIKAEQFHQVQQAYEILSDETKRKRYDERVKLAELRAELMAENRFKTHDYTSKTHEYSSRPPPSASYEMRGNAIYEERVPRQRSPDAPRHRSPDEDYLSGKYDDIHNISRKYTERPEYASSRRRSGPAPEEVRRSRGREYDDYDHASILRERENERKMREHAVHAERKKRRDKERRQDRQDYGTKYRYAHVEVVSESDSEDEPRRERRYTAEPKRKHENTRHKAKPSKYQNSESDSDLESKHFRSAMSHIQRKEGRPTSYRYVTKDGAPVNVASPPIPVPPPPPPAPSQRYRDEVDTPRRSTARSRSSRDESRPKLSREERRPSVIDVSEARRPNLSSFTSAPSQIRIPPTPERHMPSRSSTMESRSRSTKVSDMPRSATTPLANTFSSRYSSDSDRVKSSKKKPDIYESPGSGSRSPSPEYQRPPIKYRVSHNSSDDRSNARVVSLEPERPSHSSRNLSPQTKRPSASTRGSSSVRVPPLRTSSFAPEHVSAPVRPSVNRSETLHEPHRSPNPPSARSGKFQLFGEVSYAPKISAKEAVYSPLRTPVSGSYYEKDQDGYRPESRSRPAVSRRDAYRRGETAH